ncbi:MAG: caspase family protein [Hyphomicrobiaceae bacterium]
MLCRLATILVLCLVSPWATAIEARAEVRRVALVIGNDTYENVASLQKARNDARAMAEALKGLGFDVVEAEDLGRRAISRAVLELEKRINPGDVALFYYAGHGFAIEGRNYLLPVDIPAPEPGEEAIVQDEAFVADDLADRLRQAGASTAILVLDACRDNPFASSGKRSLAGTRGLARMSPSEGVFVLFSAGLNQAALDRLSDSDANPNSVFTRTLLDELKAPGKTIVEIAKQTQVKVRALAAKVGHEQAPAYYDQIIGNVVLNDGEVAGGSAGTFTEGQSEVALLPVPEVPDVAGKPQPIASFTRSGTSWIVSVSLPEAAVQFGYRIGESGAFTDNGTLDVLDQRTGQRMPKTHFELDGDQAATMLYVTWRDKRGEEAGVFPIAFDPDRELKAGQKSILKDTSSAWVSFREYNGLLVYFSHLVSYRCAIKSVRYGLDGAAPDTIFEMPPCDPANPFTMPDSFMPLKELPKKTKSLNLVIEFFDGEQVAKSYKVKL